MPPRSSQYPSNASDSRTAGCSTWSIPSWDSRLWTLSGSPKRRRERRGRGARIRRPPTPGNTAMPVERVGFADGRVFDVEHPELGLSFADAVRLAEAAEGTVGTVGSYTPPPSPGKYRGAGVGPSPAYSYSACVAEVDVDPATGIVRV